MKKSLFHALSIILLCSISNAQTITLKPSAAAFVFPNGVSVPSDYPHVNIPLKTNPDSGLIFINNWGGTPYIAILDNNGAPVFYRKMPANARDFKLQMNGNLSYRLADPYYLFQEMDSSYTVLRNITAKNGFGTDEHELQILPNGNVLLIALEWKTVDMSALVPGGKTNATVVGNHIQEIDPAGTVVFEWKCWDNLTIADAVHENLTAQSIDYVHMNAIAVDTDGNILFSARHLSQVVKINRKTGKVMWRLGGKNSSFTFVGDPLNGPSYQHDIRALGNGHYTIMDNGNFHSPSVSRAVEYVLDTVAMKATLVWQYRHTPDRYTWWMGNVQRLPNGNTLINWADGSLPKLTEVTQAGVKAMEMGFVNYAHSYRVFRFPWKGKASAPVISVDAGTDKMTILINKFDQQPKHTYLLYGDTVPNPTRLIDSTSFSAVDLTGFRNGKRYYFRATAKDEKGTESPYSNEESAVAKFFKPGDNLVLNGDFAEGTAQWNYAVTAPAVGNSYITAAGEFFAQIGNGGTQAWHIQLSQGGIPLANGSKYRLEFDASSVSSSRTIDVRIEKAVSPFTNYSKTSIVALTTVPKHYFYDFTMQDPTDNGSRVVFNCGLSDIDVLIDNISIKQLIPQAAADKMEQMPAGFALEQNFPNPFNPETVIAYTLPVTGVVRLVIYDLLGRTVAVPVNGIQSAGYHQVTIPSSRYGLTSGIYFYSLMSGSLSTTKRMLLIQ
jgi:hypothetical protein